MTTTHECGHMIGGMTCGATLTDFDLAPWRMPYSLHSPDPNPLVTLWAGPIFGIAVPTFLAAIIRKRWAWFIADFCLIANGGYLALASLSGDRFLDTPRLLDAGAHPATIVIYCMLTIGIGYIWFRSDCIHYLAPKSKQRDGGEPCDATESGLHDFTSG
ncbi:hypothetical protein [Rubripirellula reticaptiva]|uniref:MraY-like glycosyltransferase n=1 Tax=Rubripirellula reticaptiva TaxID=2528013 RepID=A0A5C6EWC9_9BACT|nr:hypothetical protein [Rubripirellula reticaptiva]TWU51541.1 hypothetical protein Poly59_31330 [Rubripirellula reticaptiva]